MRIANNFLENLPRCLNLKSNTVSHNWGSQELVKKIYKKLVDAGIPCWMDSEGGMELDMMTAMSRAVQNAAAIVPFCTHAYQESKNCHAELSMAFDRDCPIIPVICDAGYTKKPGFGETIDASQWPTDWLFGYIAGKLYSDLTLCDQ